jgi:hypothetical protein
MYGWRLLDHDNTFPFQKGSGSIVGRSIQLTTNNPPELFRSGFHASENILDAFSFIYDESGGMPKKKLARVRLSNDVRFHGDIAVGKSVRIYWVTDTIRPVRKFCEWLLERAEPHLSHCSNFGEVQRLMNLKWPAALQNGWRGSISAADMDRELIKNVDFADMRGLFLYYTAKNDPFINSASIILSTIISKGCRDKEKEERNIHNRMLKKLFQNRNKYQLRKLRRKKAPSFKFDTYVAAPTFLNHAGPAIIDIAAKHAADEITKYEDKCVIDALSNAIKARHKC